MHAKRASLLFWLIPVSAALHLALLLFLPKPEAPPPASHSVKPSITVHLRALPALENPTPNLVPIATPIPPAKLLSPPPHIAEAKRTPPGKPPSKAEPTSPTADAPMAEATTASTSAANNTAPAVISSKTGNTALTIAPQLLDGGSDLQSLAKRGLGKIDHDLRNELPPQSQARSNALGRAGPTKLERDIAAAGIPHATTIEEINGPGGQKMTKVTGPGGTYCLWSPKQVSTFDKQPETRATNCPK